MARGARPVSGVTGHAATTWLRSQVARRVHQIDALTDLPQHDRIVAPLGKPTGPNSREDTTCDRCRARCPDGRGFWSFQVCPRPNLILVAGLCATCASSEGIA